MQQNVDGLATEMARAAIARARTQPGFVEIVADADEVNTRSVRLLEKLGFERLHETPYHDEPTLVLKRQAWG